MTLRSFAYIAPVVLLLNACSGKSNYNFEETGESQEADYAASVAPQANFSPSDGVIPFPNSILLLGSEDGTINAPVADPENLADPSVALNQMDGFSTTSPISTGLSKPVNLETVTLGETVRVFEVTTDPTTSAVTGVVGELVATDVAVTATDNQLLIVPVKPLKEKTSYLVALTNGITDAEGAALTPSLTYRLVAGTTILEGPVGSQLEPLRQLTQSHLGALEAAQVDRSSVVLSWTFGTQSINDVLLAVKAQTTAQPLVVANSNLTTSFVEGLQGKADVFIGTLDLPYYLTVPAADDSTFNGALNGFWRAQNGGFVTRYNPAPQATATVTVPVLMTVPNASSAAGGTAPGAGWPVTIFQHGIGQNRTNMVLIADAMADVGRAMIAIDLPLHGLINPTDAIHADMTAFPNDQERTFAIDVVEPMNEPDPSGTHFYNLRNLANSRDNLRQGVADLLTLRASLAGIVAADGSANAQLDASNVSFVGHSLGGIVGSTFLAMEDTVSSATIAMAGGGIAQLLANSERFSSDINEGLTEAGAAPGTPEYAQFLLAAQTVIDSGDPINHAGTIGGKGTPVHFIEVVGDTVVPNNVLPIAPLSGTDPLAAYMGLSPVSNTTSGGGLVRFIAGDHGSIINPTASLEATIEMQTQTAVFAASAGTTLLISNPAVIEAGN